MRRTTRTIRYGDIGPHGAADVNAVEDAEQKGKNRESRAAGILSIN